MKDLMPVYLMLKGLRAKTHKRNLHMQLIPATRKSPEKTIEELESEQTEKEFEKSKAVDAMSDDALNAFLKSNEARSLIMVGESRKKRLVAISQRDAELSAAMKRKAKHLCQICEQPSFQGKDGYNFTESHHIIPRGKGGADDPRNILILCPNCHRKFDSGNKETQVEAYKTIRAKNLFSDLAVLKEVGQITNEIYNEIM
jgi:predicted HNH restriction endonuclease